MTQQTPLSDRWLEYAQRDLDVAKHLHQHFQPTSYEIICYQCQQAAEKALKALYIAQAIPEAYPAPMIFPCCWIKCAVPFRSATIFMTWPMS